MEPGATTAPHTHKSTAALDNNASLQTELSLVTLVMTERATFATQTAGRKMADVTWLPPRDRASRSVPNGCCARNQSLARLSARISRTLSVCAVALPLARWVRNAVARSTLKLSNRAFVRKFNTEASFFNNGFANSAGGQRTFFYVDHGFEFLPARRVLAADGLHTSFEGTALLASHIKDISFGEKRNTRSEWSDPTIAEAAATETTEVPLTSQEEFPRLPPPPPHPAQSLPHAPVTLPPRTNSRTNSPRRMSAGIRQPQVS
ncbi:hypothetical protein HPB50_004771 [Hyalomma asiaticum]|uniref:Uncharacterized protein n=1 Tax=Hyalomma asiaticum TaxID=266040 RepID=A0ACB7TD52_HYAAI|nr:hypothetical protein HPB50_004771 [Hyalomma asiaticum]